MRRFWNTAIAICLLCAMTLAIVPSGVALAATATETEYHTVELSYEELSEDAYTAIQAALDEARDNATAETPYKIVVPEGKYTLQGGLNIYSNTWLYAKGVTFVKPKKLSNNMIRVGDGSSAADDNDEQQGYYYKNIIVEGATFNAKNGKNTVIKVAHASGVTLKKCTFKNTVNAHLMEVAGVKNFKVQGCKFKNQTISESATVLRYEAIQIDILESYHFPGYLEENLQNKNIVIKNCLFQNVPRGVGSHTAVLNSPVDGVKITGCTFEDTKSAAIQSLNWINVTISDNVITGTPRGIAIYSMRSEGVYLPSTLELEGGVPTSTSDSYVEPSSDQNIVISENVISTDGSDPYISYYEEAAISLFGFSISEAGEEDGIEEDGIEEDSVEEGTGDPLPAGEYPLSGVTVKDNAISTNGHGIRLSMTKNATVEDNGICYTGTSPTRAYYGIYLRYYSEVDTITGNTVTDMAGHGILLNEGSEANAIENNTVESAEGSGIIVEASATVDRIASNIIEAPAVNGIHIYNLATVDSVEENEVDSPGKYGIDVEHSTVAMMKKNKIDGSGNTGIFVYDSANVTEIWQNSVAAAGKYGINVEASTADLIYGNEITEPYSDGIYMNRASSVSKTQKNVIKSAGDCGIRAGGSSSAETVRGNTIKNCEGDGISAQGGAGMEKVIGNTIKNCGGDGISVQDGADIEKVRENDIRLCGGRGISVESLTGVMKIKENTVARCGTDALIYLSPETTEYKIAVKDNTLRGASESPYKKVNGIYADGCKVSVSGNKIVNTKRAIRFTKGVKGKLGKNKYKNNRLANKYFI